MTAKYQVEDIFYHKTKNIYMYIDSIQKTDKGILYALKTIIPTHNEKKGIEDEWKRYYEEKLERECARIAQKCKSDIIFASTK